MEISEPVPLARLPRSPQGSPEVRFGHVWQWRNGVKRKRHEVCAAVDGASLNIYEAQSGRLLLSHAVPPTATFSGPPFSLRWKDQDTTCRQTCFVTSDQGSRLHTFTSRGTKNDKESSIELPISASPVIQLDISLEKSSGSVTVLQSDGTLTVASRDLASVAVNKLSLKQTAHTNILAANILDPATARKTVLKARPDLYSSLTDDSRIISIATGSLDDTAQRRSVSYAAWSIVPTITPTATRIEVIQLFEYSLTQLVPALAAVSIDIFSTTFGPRFAFVDLKTSQGLVRFDLQAATPRPTIALSELSTGLSSHVAISPAYALATFPGKLRILDVNYSTVQHSLDQKAKRKRNAQNPSTHLQLICYFSHINRALARDGLRLIAIDLRSSAGSGTRQNMTSTLAENISRGVTVRPQVATDLLIAEQSMGGSMQQKLLAPELKQHLIQLLEKDDMGAFESTLLESLLPEANERRSGIAISDDIVDFVLSKLFSVQAPSEDQNFETRLRLNVVAPRLLDFLNERGLLRLSKLKRALRIDKDQIGTQLQHDDIAKALQNADHSLALLAAYATIAAIPDVYEQTLLLKFLVQQVLLIGSEAQQPRLLAAGSSMDMPLEALADSQHDRPKELLVLERCLIAVMDQYIGFELSSISSSIRSTLSGDEIFGVVQVLRQQMFRGGHTGSTLTASDEEPISQQERVSLKAAVNILSACLDATGPLNLISGEFEDKLIERIIPDLLSEISLATQYIEESADLQGILRETLRYTESHQPRRRGLTTPHGTALKGGRAGEIATLYAQRTEDEDINGLPGALPLSLRADEAIKPTKIRRGGGQIQERSQREMLMLENRQKGPYAFERLVL